MSQGIGVRFTASGARALRLEKTDDALIVTGLAAGEVTSSLEEFLNETGMYTDGIPVACGLCPGDFLSTFATPDESMEEAGVKDHLKWEIKRKMVSPHEDYRIDYAIADRGFAFAGRKKLIQTRRGSITQFVTDVEPVALLNGCELIGEVNQKNVLLISIEGEGISSVYMSYGELLALESFPVQEDDYSPALAGLYGAVMETIPHDSMQRLADFAVESIDRMKLFGKSDEKVDFDEIILTGSGLYLEGINQIISDKSQIMTILSNPLRQLSNDVKEQKPQLVEKAAAFTTCYGLAARALEL